MFLGTDATGNDMKMAASTFVSVFVGILGLTFSGTVILGTNASGNDMKVAAVVWNSGVTSSPTEFFGTDAPDSDKSAGNSGTIGRGASRR